MFGIPTFDLLSDRGKQEFIEYVVGLTRKEINSYTPSYNNVSASTMLTDASLPTTGTAGTYTKVTTDVYGRVASGTTLVAADIPILTLAKISDAGTAAAKDIPATGNASATQVVYGSDTRLTTAAANQVVYKNGSNVAVGNATFTFDTSALYVPYLKVNSASGDEGGQIDLIKPVTNTTLNTGVSIDVYQDKLRVFETGSPYTGVYIDIGTSAASAGDELATTGDITTHNADTTSVHGISNTANLVVANDTSYLNPTGSILAYAGINTPTGWLLCDGASVSRTTYATLFAATSTSFATATTTSTSTTVSGLTGMATPTHVGWGIAGNGIPTGATISSVTNATTVVISAAATVTAIGTASLVISPYKFTGANNTTTFLVPDLCGNVPVGVKSAQTSNPDISALGKTAGAYTYTITANDLPTHNHAVGTLTNGSESAHTHSVTAAGTLSGSTGSFDARHTHADTLTYTFTDYAGSGINHASAGTYNRLTFTQTTVSTGGSVTAATNNNAATPLSLNHSLSSGTLAFTGSAVASLGGSAHTHTISGSTANNTTTATAVSLVQPVIALNFIIKT